MSDRSAHAWGGPMPAAACLWTAGCVWTTGWRLTASLLLTFAATQACAQAADARRTGFQDMSPALQAMQRDETQNPAMLWVSEGEALWSRPVANGRSCAACHVDPATAASRAQDTATRPAAPAADTQRSASAAASSQAPLAAATRQAVFSAAIRYPVFDAANQRPLTLHARVDHCRQQHQQAKPQGPDGSEVLALTAFLTWQARGKQLAPDRDPRLDAWQQRGEQLFQQRFGQLNLACTHCHDQRAGLRLGGALIPQAHPTGVPSYRLEWQTLGSLERRLRSCLVGVRAEPFAPDADEWLALEVFLARRAAGMAIEGAAVRP